MKKIYLLMLLLIPSIFILGQGLEKNPLPGTCGIINQQLIKSGGISLKSANSILNGTNSRVEVVAQSPVYTQNCIPFGQNVQYGFQGFVYRNLPAFTVAEGDTLCFDLGATNDVPINRNIYFSTANINPTPYNGNTQGVTATSWVLMVPETQTPLNPYGNYVVGDFELKYVCTSSFNFTGGGFIIGFGGTPPGTYVDNGCEQVLNCTTSQDISGYFYCRFYLRSDKTMAILDSIDFDANELASFMIKSGGGLPSVTISSDSASCGAVYDYTFPVPEKGSIVQVSGLPSGSEFQIGTTTNCFEVTDSLGEKKISCFNVTVVDSTAPVATCKSVGGNGELRKAAYVISTAGQPWNVNTNVAAMDSVFGVGNWDQLYFETVNSDNLFSKDYEFIYMEGGDHGANEMEVFVDMNVNKMQEWVLDGGNLFLNAAPNEGNGMDWGFWGVHLQYNGGPYSPQVTAADSTHAIFHGPFTPVTMAYGGNYFAHAILPGELNAKVLINESSHPDYHVLSEFEWGDGKVLIGGMTTTNFHWPQPEAFNLRANMLYYLGTKSSLDFQLNSNNQLTITPQDIDGGSTDNCEIASMELDRTDFTLADLGKQTVTLTVTDKSGNTSTCSTTINILEGDNPPAPPVDNTVKCNPIDINLFADGNYKLDSLDMIKLTGVTPTENVSFDDLMIFAYPDTFTVKNIEWPVFVRITSYDENYNKSRCWAMVTVHDLTPPTISASNIELVLDQSGQADLSLDMVTDSTLFDASGIDTVSVSQTAFSCNDLGTNLVTITASDIYGNTATDTISVLITDNQIPVVEPVNDVEVAVSAGVCWTTVNYPVPVVIDNCDYTLTQTGGLGASAQFPVGTTTESWLVTDKAGNSAEFEFNVTVIATNALPTLDPISDITETNDKTEITIPVTGISYGNDCKPQEIELTAEADNNELIESISTNYTDGDATGSLKVKLMTGMTGDTKITVHVTDSEGASIYRKFNLKINNNSLPKDGNLTTYLSDNTKDSGVKMYPNPTKERVTIEIGDANTKVAEIAVFSITGSEVYRNTFYNTPNISLSMKEQVSGVYMVKMNIDGKNVIKKLVLDKK